MQQLASAVHHIVLGDTPTYQSLAQSILKNYVTENTPNPAVKVIHLTHARTENTGTSIKNTLLITIHPVSEIRLLVSVHQLLLRQSTINLTT